jgi:membrane-bound lytic murein transglycosylase F
MDRPAYLTLAIKSTVFLLFFIAITSWLSSCKKSLTQLERIQKSGILKIATRVDPTTYHHGPNGPIGLEYDLVQLFAKQLGVSVQVSTIHNFSEILEQIETGKTDIAAAGLTITKSRQKKMRFAPGYQKITEQIIYRSGTKRPKKPEHLTLGLLEVVNNTSHIESLKKLKQKVPELTWKINNNLDSSGLIYLVNQGLIDYTVADSNQFALLRRFYPKLYSAFSISKPRYLAWALNRSDDNSLYNEVTAFFKKIKNDKTLDQLIERHYGYVASLNYVDLCKFREHLKSRLPAIQNIFEKAGKKHNLDWRLIAAISYQESHWRNQATSPTGVKGLMMLTRSTAKQLKIKDRTNPYDSIFGGANYFQMLYKRIPNHISEPDRTWMALAAYNIGFGHLEDARILTQKRGKNPDLWLNIKKSLPLLTKKRWYKQTKHGYARGYEPVKYVENIRSYYDLLIWLTEEDQIENRVMTVYYPKNTALTVKGNAL